MYSTLSSSFDNVSSRRSEVLKGERVSYFKNIINRRFYQFELKFWHRPLMAIILSKPSPIFSQVSSFWNLSIILVEFQFELIVTPFL